MNSKFKKIVCSLVLGGTLITSASIAKAIVWQGTLDGYVYNQGLFSKKLSSTSPLYESTGQTRWDKDPKVYVYIEGANASNPRGVIGSPVTKTGATGWVELKTQINSPSLAFWHSAHRTYNTNGTIRSGSEITHWINAQ